MFCNFYLVKSHKVVNNSATIEAREKINTDLKSLEFQKFLGISLTKFENYQNLLNKISHRILVTTRASLGREKFCEYQATGSVFTKFLAVILAICS
jgi:hypothetical protein